jgi:hypothetical protein
MTTAAEVIALTTTVTRAAVIDNKIVVGTEDLIVAKTDTIRILVSVATTTIGVHVTPSKNVFGTVV